MAKVLLGKFKSDPTTGFGNKASTQGTRLLRKDGTYNVIRKGLPLFARFNIFHELINMKWLKFVTIVFSFYALVNICFAGIFLLVGMEQIEGDSGITLSEHFWDAFFFSSQTLTTVGYGRTSPIGFSANLVAAFECLIGLMMFAIVTGLLYGRFSRPQAKLLYSRNAIIGPYKEINALMFRIANGRRNQLIECEAQVMMSYIDTETNNRRFIPLTLEFSTITALALSWTLVHPITADSPLNGLDAADLVAMDVEFLFIFKAFDDTYSQTVHTRYSYSGNEVIWGAKFRSMYGKDPGSDGTILDLLQIGAYDDARLNIAAAAPESMQLP